MNRSVVANYNYGEGMIIIKRLEKGFFVVMEKFCILNVVVVTGIYICDKISWNYTLFKMHIKLIKFDKVCNLKYFTNVNFLVC